MRAEKRAGREKERE